MKYVCCCVRMGFQTTLLLLLAIFISNGIAAGRECNPQDEFPCLNKDCIHKLQWCDNKRDCRDGSDEKFCNVSSCPAGLFRCDNGRCIPASAKCNGYDDCRDGSDERCRSQASYSGMRNSSRIDDRSGLEKTLNTTDAVTKAVMYLLKKKEIDHGWRNFTPRAVVALAFAWKSGRIPDGIITSVKRELNINILMGFMQNGQPSMCDLAHYINALYATCQDPRNFQGIDLVRKLRSQVDSTRNISLPFPLLTLCIAGMSNNADTRRLIDLFDETGKNRLGSKALIVMAFACISSGYKTGTSPFRDRLSRFTRDISSAFKADIYSKALFIQALDALGYKAYKMEDGKSASLSTYLSSHQHLDGSFGDLLATYHAIPALLNQSLLDLKCLNRNEGVKGAYHLPSDPTNQAKVKYSLRIEKESYTNIHYLTLPLDGNVTFYDVMRMAEDKNSVFSFLYDITSVGKKVYSLAGIPNDAETGRSWNLYRKYDNGQGIKKENLISQDKGVDQIFPRENQHFVFWFEHS